jgi:hypothetical protein
VYHRLQVCVAFGGAFFSNFITFFLYLCFIAVAVGGVQTVQEKRTVSGFHRFNADLVFAGAGYAK